jgi:benzoyl-CoA reductase/2-hydroxyglutaryl-CoA dehydratase subunit BcrC/BadD/HgdB
VTGIECQGLDCVKEIYRNRTRRVRELSAEGKKVIGYFHIYPVLEMLTALDLVPFGLTGDMGEPITKADACLPTVVCPFIRSMVDLGLKGRYDFLSGVVMAHACEVAEKTAHIWRTYLDPPYAHFIDTPHTTHAAAQKQHKELLKGFKGTLESYTGKKLTDERLREAITLHNRQRTLVRELYELRKPAPPLISGSETLQVVLALMSLPVLEGNRLLAGVISQVKERNNGPSRQPARLLVWGSIIDDPALMEMIEGSGANVVMDDTTTGSRAYFPQVELTEDPLDGLSYRYLVELKSPRTYRENILKGASRKDYMADLENRFGYLRGYIEEWNVNGVILQTVRFCDIHGYEIPGLRDYFDSIGVPHTYLEHDYSRAALAQLRTRVQAFIEVIG